MTDISVEIAQSEDDVADYGFNWVTFDTNDLYYYIGQGEALNYHKTGWRFQTVNIPQGATITVATLTLPIWPGISGSGYWRSICYGVATDNLAVWSSTNRPKNATPTTAYVAKQGNSAGVPNGTYNIQNWDVKTILQEIVSRAGWVANNSLGFLLHDNGGDESCNLQAFTFDNYPNSPKAVLTATYTTGGVIVPAAQIIVVNQ